MPPIDADTPGDQYRRAVGAIRDKLCGMTPAVLLGADDLATHRVLIWALDEAMKLELQAARLDGELERAEQPPYLQ